MHPQRACQLLRGLEGVRDHVEDFLGGLVNIGRVLRDGLPDFTMFGFYHDAL